MIPSVQTDPMIEEQFSIPMVIFFGLDVDLDALQMYKLNLCLRQKNAFSRNESSKILGDSFLENAYFGSKKNIHLIHLYNKNMLYLLLQI